MAYIALPTETVLGNKVLDLMIAQVVSLQMNSHASSRTKQGLVFRVQGLEFTVWGLGQTLNPNLKPNN